MDREYKSRHVSSLLGEFVLGNTLETASVNSIESRDMPFIESSLKHPSGLKSHEEYKSDSKHIVESYNNLKLESKFELPAQSLSMSASDDISVISNDDFKDDN